MLEWLWGGKKPIKKLNVLHSGNKYVLTLEPGEKDITVGSLKQKLSPLLDVPASLLTVYQTSPKRALGNDKSTLVGYGLKDGETLLVVGEKPVPKTASEQIAACVSTVETELGDRIKAFSAAPPADEAARNKEFLVLNEVVLQNILKLDGIEAEGEVRKQRKEAINKLQKYHSEIDGANKRSLAVKPAAEAAPEAKKEQAPAPAAAVAPEAAPAAAPASTTQSKESSPAPKSKNKKKKNKKR